MDQLAHTRALMDPSASLTDVFLGKGQGKIGQFRPKTVGSLGLIPGNIADNLLQIPLGSGGEDYLERAHSATR